MSENLLLKISMTAENMNHDHDPDCDPVSVIGVINSYKMAHLVIGDSDEVEALGKAK